MKSTLGRDRFAAAGRGVLPNTPAPDQLSDRERPGYTTCPRSWGIFNRYFEDYCTGADTAAIHPTNRATLPAVKTFRSSADSKAFIAFQGFPFLRGPRSIGRDTRVTRAFVKQWLYLLRYASRLLCRRVNLNRHKDGQGAYFSMRGRVGEALAPGSVSLLQTSIGDLHIRQLCWWVDLASFVCS